MKKSLAISYQNCFHIMELNIKFINNKIREKLVIIVDLKNLQMRIRALKAPLKKFKFLKKKK